MRLAFVGDLALGDHPKTRGFGFFSRYRTGIPTHLLSHIKPPGAPPDVFFGNLEYSLATEGSHADLNTCCLGVTSFIPDLGRSGITVLNVANNHSWEHGAYTFWETVRLLQGAGFKVIGIPEDFDPTEFIRIDGKTIAFLGWSARPRQGFSTSPDYNEFHEGECFNQIREVRNHCDLVCVSIHWGEEFFSLPSAWERQIARTMIEAGAGVVVGHHPHVLREIERYKGGIIAYSLGNFIGDMTWNPLTRQTGCLVVETDGAGITKTFYPAFIEDDFFPRYLDESASQRWVSSEKARLAGMAKCLETGSYEVLAKKALVRNKWLTFRFLLKNIHKYQARDLGNILAHAMLVRLYEKR